MQKAEECVLLLKNLQHRMPQCTIKFTKHSIRRYIPSTVYNSTSTVIYILGHITHPLVNCKYCKEALLSSDESNSQFGVNLIDQSINQPINRIDKSKRGISLVQGDNNFWSETSPCLRYIVKVSGAKWLESLCCRRRLRSVHH